MGKIGVYIHIPFCKSRCKYCDFYSTTMLNRSEEYVEALEASLQSLCETLSPRGEREIGTIYFGGGTPSLLEVNQIERILTPLIPFRGEARDVEITMEVNPGDLTPEKLRGLREAGVNRLSIGIQSLDNELLHRIGRRHNAEEAIEAVRMAREAGFRNISIDLMYGLPGQTMQQWEETIDRAIALNAEHISTYCLSYEEGTALTRMLERGEISEVDEDTENAMFDLICDKLAAAGYVHYEVSNFARPGYRSKHNSGYWNDTPYIGLGAGAHSYDGRVRRWNISDLEAYIHGVKSGECVSEEEVLTDEQRAIEKVMLRLRTCEGVYAEDVKTHAEIAKSYVERGMLREENGRYVATRAGLKILNRIIEDLIE